MSSGEADAIRSMRTLDSYRRCSVDGCEWHIRGAERCHIHGGDPVAGYLRDEWGEEAETYADPALVAAWREWQSEE